MIRKFENGATRDTTNGKFEYFGFRHPLVEQSFARYMHNHRTQSDGSLRDSNNWWKGWDTNVSLQSMIRHMEDLQALDAGLVVVEIRHKDGSVEKVYATEPVSLDKGDTLKAINREECCNAIRFNSGAYLLEVMKNY